MVEKHAAAFRDISVAETRCAEKIEQVFFLSYLPPSVWLHGCQKWDVRDVALSSNPARFEASSKVWVGRHIYATICSTFLSKPNATLFSLLLHSAPAELELLHTPPMHIAIPLP